MIDYVALANNIDEVARLELVLRASEIELNRLRVHYELFHLMMDVYSTRLSQSK